MISVETSMLRYEVYGGKIVLCEKQSLYKYNIFLLQTGHFDLNTAMDMRENYKMQYIHM